MTVCNMTIEGGARAGLIAPDETTFEYIKDKPRAPKGEAWDRAVEYWKTLHTDEGAHYDRVVVLDAANLPPIVSWGSSPEDVVSVQGVVPNPDDIQDETKRTSKWRALDYMGLKPGTKITISPSTGCSSAPAPMAASRTCAPSPRWSKAARSPRPFRR